MRVLMGLFILTAFSFHAAGQRKKDQKQELDEHLVQFSGMIRDLQHRPLPHVNIIILTEKRGTTSDKRGMFSFVVRPSDTILFSHMGHKGTIHVIPDSLGGQQYPADIFMVSDTFHLAEVRIYPWKTYQQFKEAFLALDLVELDSLPLGQGLESLALDGRVVDEDILGAVVKTDKTKTLAVVEPLHCTLCHDATPLQLRAELPCPHRSRQRPFLKELICRL